MEKSDLAIWLVITFVVIAAGILIGRARDKIWQQMLVAILLVMIQTIITGNHVYDTVMKSTRDETLGLAITNTVERFEHRNIRPKAFFQYKDNMYLLNEDDRFYS